VGLGNPGSRYRKTRHNIGFLAIESLITGFNARIAEGTELFESHRAEVDGADTALILPQTYMNNSGEAVREYQQQFQLPLDDILIVYDDFQLPFGTLRLRPKGSDGGHNGLASIIYHLESDLVPRLRIGIGGISLPEDHTHESMAEYVLSPFDADEEKQLPRLFEHIRDACSSWIRSDIGKTMSQYNKNFFSSAGAE
jgi:PTH1 family peptidyl-tRNA hydrolase